MTTNEAIEILSDVDLRDPDGVGDWDRLDKAIQTAIESLKLTNRIESLIRSTTKIVDEYDKTEQAKLMTYASAYLTIKYTVERKDNEKIKGKD